MSLVKIQAELKAPKSQYNSFGKYKYRNVEDILEALKPILLKYNHELTLSDDLVLIGDRFYVKATATLKLNQEIISESTGWAREDEVKKGMDSSQITGSCSSYARKYALNAMFLIDDTKDADTLNEHKDELTSDDKLYLITLLENTTYDEEMKKKLALKIDNFTTKAQYDAAMKTIKMNQIEDKDRISMGLNYNQSDIKKTQKSIK